MGYNFKIILKIYIVREFRTLNLDMNHNIKISAPTTDLQTRSISGPDLDPNIPIYGPPDDLNTRSRSERRPRDRKKTYHRCSHSSSPQQARSRNECVSWIKSKTHKTNGLIYQNKQHWTVEMHNKKPFVSI